MKTYRYILRTYERTLNGTIRHGRFTFDSLDDATSCAELLRKAQRVEYVSLSSLDPDFDELEWGNEGIDDEWNEQELFAKQELEKAQSLAAFWQEQAQKCERRGE